MKNDIIEEILDSIISYEEIEEDLLLEFTKEIIKFIKSDYNYENLPLSFSSLENYVYSYFDNHKYESLNLDSKINYQMGRLYSLINIVKEYCNNKEEQIEFSFNKTKH